jgi:hypothetical protein
MPRGTEYRIRQRVLDLREAARARRLPDYEDWWEA